MRELVSAHSIFLDIDALLHHLVQRGHFAEPVHLADHQVGDEVHVRFRVESAETETDAGVRQFVANTQRGVRNSVRD